ncbi:2-oxoglutarate and iron-dependent oxygenase domain-containing protein 3-like isoform X1, partial [Leptotrombidium deliense]
AVILIRSCISNINSEIGRRTKLAITNSLTVLIRCVSSLHEVNCSEKGYRREREIGGAPQRCGTLIYDNLVTVEEASKLRKLAEKLINRIGDSSRYIRESLNLKWVNLHNVFRKGAQLKIFTEKDYKLIRKTGDAVKQVVCNTFGLREELVFFSNVSQFTRHKPVTQFSEFRHVDKVRSPSLIVTTILWLSTVDFDFIGGRLEFLTGGPEPFSPLLIDPKFGRFSAWTSSYENPHAVHEIVAGERYALIFAFTASQEIGHASIDHLREWAFSFDELNLM